MSDSALTGSLRLQLETVFVWNQVIDGHEQGAFQ